MKKKYQDYQIMRIKKQKKNPNTNNYHEEYSILNEFKRN